MQIISQDTEIRLLLPCNKNNMIFFSFKSHIPLRCQLSITHDSFLSHLRKIIYKKNDDFALKSSSTNHKNNILAYILFVLSRSCEQKHECNL